MFVAGDTRQAPGAPIFTAPGGLHAHFPIWSADGAFIYFVQGDVPDKMDIWRVKRTGGSAERITMHTGRVSHPVLLDARTLVYLANDADGSGPWLYRYPTSIDGFLIASLPAASATHQCRPVPAEIGCWLPSPIRNARFGVFRWARFETTGFQTIPRHPAGLRSPADPRFHRGSARTISCISRLLEDARACGRWSVNRPPSCGVARMRKSSERPRFHPMDVGSRYRPASTDARFSMFYRPMVQTRE